MDCGSMQGLMEGRVAIYVERLSTPREQRQFSIDQYKDYHSGHAS